MSVAEQFTVSAEEAGTRLDRFLAAHLPALSRSRLKALIEGAHVTASGETTLRGPVTDPSRRVKAGQTFVIVVPDAEPAVPVPQAIPLDVLYEDSDLIVLNKPAGLVVHPAPGNPDMTLVNALIAHCGDSLSGIGGVRRPGIVHRLDKDTSGLMVAAKTDRAHQALADAFAQRRIERAYQAIVWGTPSPRAGDIAGAIGRHSTDRKRMTVVSRGGKAALTRYKVLQPLGPAASLVECRLATGRTHQIRVHMAAIGHPVVGDRVYGRATRAGLEALGAQGRSAVIALQHQALHAYILGFEHPVSGEPLRWEVGLPSDLQQLAEVLSTNN